MKGWYEEDSPYQAHPSSDAEFTKFLRRRMAERESEYRGKNRRLGVAAFVFSVLVWVLMVAVFLTAV